MEKNFKVETLNYFSKRNPFPDFLYQGFICSYLDEENFDDIIVISESYSNKKEYKQASFVTEKINKIINFLESGTNWDYIEVLEEDLDEPDISDCLLFYYPKKAALISDEIVENSETIPFMRFYVYDIAREKYHLYYFLKETDYLDLYLPDDESTELDIFSTDNDELYDADETDINIDTCEDDDEEENNNGN